MCLVNVQMFECDGEKDELEEESRVVDGVCYFTGLR